LEIFGTACFWENRNLNVENKNKVTMYTVEGNIFFAADESRSIGDVDESCQAKMKFAYNTLHQTILELADGRIDIQTMTFLRDNEVLFLQTQHALRIPDGNQPISKLVEERTAELNYFNKTRDAVFCAVNMCRPMASGRPISMYK
jgi:hypothetical protein